MLKKIITLLAWVICFGLASTSYAENKEIDLQNKTPRSSSNSKKYGYSIRLNIYHYYSPGSNIDAIKFSSKNLKFKLVKSALKTNDKVLYWSLRKGSKCIDFQLNKTVSYIKFCKSWSYKQILKYLGKFELSANNESLARFKLQDKDIDFYIKNKKSILDCRKHSSYKFLLATENISGICISEKYEPKSIPNDIGIVAVPKNK